MFGNGIEREESKEGMHTYLLLVRMLCFGRESCGRKRERENKWRKEGRKSRGGYVLSQCVCSNFLAFVYPRSTPTPVLGLAGLNDTKYGISYLITRIQIMKSASSSHRSSMSRTRFP